MRAARRVAATTITSTALLLPAAAWAQCSASGSNVTCSGTSTSYTYTGTSAANITVNSGATVTAPLTAAVSGSTLTNAGTISNTAAAGGVVLGDSATVTNNGTITSTGTTSGATAITVGANSTVTNNGSLTATAGTPAVNFTGVNGKFVNNAAATAAVTGTIQFGTNSGSNRASFSNSNTTYGITGSVTASGNIDAYNNGIFTGNFQQSAVSGTTVTFVNDTSGTFAGIINTGNATTLTNNGTMSLYGTTGLASALGTLQDANSTLTNNGTLYIGTQAAPTQATVYGNVVLNSGSTLNIAVASAGASLPTAGTSYSQLYASNASGALASGGNITLGGTLNVNVAAGFYSTGSKYNLLLADKSITGSFSTVNATTTVTTSTTDSSGVTTTTTSSNPLAFVTFSTGSVVTLGTQQAYQVTATHLLYSDVMKAAGATTNQLAVAKGLDPLITTATNAVNSSTSDPSVTLLSMVDVMDTTQAKVFFDTVSPEGYYGYATALRDQANSFARTVDLRMNDQNSNHPEDGWWMTGQGQFQVGGIKDTSKGFKTKDNLFGFSAGYDLSGPNHVIGLAFNASFDSLTFGANNLTGTNRDLAIAAYAAQNFGKLRLSGQLAYNYGHLSATHIATIGSYSTTANASASEGLFKATANLGYNIEAGGYKLTPFVGIDFNKGQVNSFTEQNAGAADLTVGSIKADRTDALAGISLTRNKGIFRPYARFAYRRKVGGGDNNIINAYFDSDPNTAFQVTALATGKSEYDANLGVNWVFDDAGALFVGYQGTMRENKYSAHGINLGIRLEF
ncbi:autotransporter outer membrane beta-barrel domain-containing protein [Novosphingobium rosa]|uniref:autotransporter outer membrane beta-barrel domain-containing protein n=1 Tax=Novosphingobium rosa TaxID=76978 RepID=UPI00083401FC|nr:autotransporter outer membrane beta-barrel domain-containing protein [Novosphingobium rosa]